MLPIQRDAFWSDALWAQSNRVFALFASGGIILALAAVDWWTKPYWSLGLLYVFPIVLAAGFLSRPALLALGVFCAVLSEAFSALDPTWRFSRFCLETLALAGCGLFVAELLRNRRLMAATLAEQRKTQERLRALAETSPAAIVTVDQDGIIELANRAAEELIFPQRLPASAADEATLIGEPIAAYLPELQNALRTGGRAQLRSSMECHARRANGERFPAEVWFSTFKENGSSKLAAIIADVTEEQPDLPFSQIGPDGIGRPSLNSRQLAVLRLVFQGLQNREIETRLQMTPSAVKNILQQLFSKAEAKNRSQLVRVALERYRDLL